MKKDKSEKESTSLAFPAVKYLLEDGGRTRWCKPRKSLGPSPSPTVCYDTQYDLCDETELGLSRCNTPALCAVLGHVCRVDSVKCRGSGFLVAAVTTA